MQTGKSLPGFSRAEMKGRGRNPAGGDCVPSFLPMPPHGGPVPRLLLLALLSLPVSPFPSTLGVHGCVQRQQVRLRHTGVCWRCPASIGMAAGSEPTRCCKEGHSASPSNRAGPCLSPALVLFLSSTQGRHLCRWSTLTDRGRHCCCPPQTLAVCVLPLPCFLSGLVALSPVVAQAEVTRAVLSTRMFRTSAGGGLGLCSCSAQIVRTRFGYCLLGRDWAPPFAMRNWWLHGNVLAGGQVWTGKRAEICCWRCRHDPASCSASAPAEPRLCKAAGQVPSPCLRVQPRGGCGALAVGFNAEGHLSDQVTPSLSH